MLCRHKLDDRRLDDRHEGHVAERRDRQRSQKICRKFLCDEDGGRAVSSTDDTD